MDAPELELLWLDEMARRLQMAVRIVPGRPLFYRPESLRLDLTAASQPTSGHGRRPQNA